MAKQVNLDLTLHPDLHMNSSPDLNLNLSLNINLDLHQKLDHDSATGASERTSVSLRRPHGLLSVIG